MRRYRDNAGRAIVGTIYAFFISKQKLRAPDCDALRYLREIGK